MSKGPNPRGKKGNLYKTLDGKELDLYVLDPLFLFYKADCIFFYIYDKEKIIKDRHTFETHFNKSFDGKEVRIIILQPVNM